MPETHSVANLRWFLPLSAVALWSTMLILGCERPFIEAREPEIEVVSPDLSVVQSEREILLEIRATSQNGVDSMLLNGLPLLPKGEGGIFSRPIRLNPGLTKLIVEAFDARGARSVDTLYAVALPTESKVGDITLPEPRGGHTALRMADGRFMVAGGAQLPTFPAEEDAWIYSPPDLHGAPSEFFMLHRRTEHTATLLPDGRVLLLGGAVITDPPTINELVEEVELFHPDSARFVSVPFSGDPIRRSGHTTILFQVGRQGQSEWFLYLYGGRGDIQYRPQPRLGIRSDIRVFQFRNDSLVAVGPTVGPHIDAVTDHTSTSLHAQSGNQVDYLVGGSIYVAEDLFDDVVFQAELSTSRGITVRSTGSMHRHRSGHAAARMVEAEVLIFGGRAFALNSAISNNEAYYSQIRLFFSMPAEADMLQKRWGHTATNWGGDRILIVGGYGETGAALRTSEWFEVDRSG